MRSDWILDVLADIKTFALSNHMPALAEHLDDTAIIAMAEISASEQRMQAQAHATDSETRTHSGEYGAG